MLRMNNRIALGSNLGKSIGNGTNNRYFTTLDGTADYYTIGAFSLSGDFILEANISTTDTASNKMVFGNNDTGNNYMGIVSNAFFLRLDGTIINHPASLEDGKLHNMKCVRTSGSIEFFVDGVSIGVTANTDTITLDRIGVYNVTNLKFNGVISEVKITDGTDLIRYYKIDEDFSTTSVLKNSATTLGGDIVTNGDFSGGVTTGWTALSLATLSVVSSRLRVTNGANYGKAQQVLTTVIGETYQLQVSGFNGTANSQIRIGTTSAGVDLLPSTNINGEFTFTFTATTTTSYLSLTNSSNGVGEYSEFDNIIVKQADGYGEAISITSSELFTLEGADWIGAELVTNGNFATDTDWNKSVGVTINGGVCSSDGSSAAYSSFVNQSSVVINGYTYKSYYEVSNITQDGLKIKLGNGLGSNQTVNGSYTEIITCDTLTTLYFQSATGSGKFIGSIDNVSVKRILQAP